MTVAIALPTLWLDDDTLRLITELELRLDAYQAVNRVKAGYYELKTYLKDLGIALPPMLRNMNSVVGWPATVVDVLEERLDLRGWVGGNYDLDDAFDANQLDVESSWCHLDALIYGCSFVAVSSGFAGEPDPLITPESPTTMTAITSPRTRRTEAALGVEYNDRGETVGAVLFLPDETLWLGNASGRWVLEDRNAHNLGRVPIVRMINRPRAGDMDGHSEITPGVQYLTDAAMRTLAASEVGREFFASPQRFVLGAPESFMYKENEDGELEPRSAWESYLGRIMAIERDADGDIPTVGEFKASSMDPYFTQIKALSTLLAAEAAIPAHYLGWVTDNPTSADAIRQGEARLVKRAERRQKQFGRGWTEVAALALLVRDGAIPAGFGAVAPQWTLAATPTRAADADRVTKLINAGVLRPDSPVTYAELGFTPEQQQQLALEVAELEAEYQAELAAQAAAPGAAAPVTPGAVAPGTTQQGPGAVAPGTT